jgi:uncharacterized protein
MSVPPTLACEALIGFQDGHAHLQGSQCADCGEVYFPAATNCTRCLSTNMQAYDIGAAGVLWSWTIQEFLPKPPYNSGETAATFKPYGVGYVQMACGLKVESRLTEADPARLAIGMPMNLVLIPYRVETEDKAVHTFAFQPAAHQQNGGIHA